MEQAPTQPVGRKPPPRIVQAAKVKPAPSSIAGKSSDGHHPAAAPAAGCLLLLKIFQPLPFIHLRRLKCFFVGTRSRRFGHWFVHLMLWAWRATIQKAWAWAC